MASGSLFVVLGCINAFLAAALLFAGLLHHAGDTIQSLRLQQRAGVSSAKSERLQKGIQVLIPFARFLLRFSAIDSFALRLQRGCETKDIVSTKESLLSLLFSVMAAGVVIFAVFGKLEIGLALAVCIPLVCGTWAAHCCDAQKEAMRTALPDALRSMSSCFGVGLTLQQTFEHLSRELKGPLRNLFSQASDEMQTATSPDLVLRHIKERGGINELSFVAVALAVQHQTGGSMQRVLEAADESLRQELELRQSLRVHTAQAKLSARVVSGVTIGLVVVMMLLSEDFLDPFLESLLGMAMLATAFAMQVAGILAVRTFLNVEVD